MNKIATAAILAELNKPLIIKKIEIPNLLEGQVLVKVLFSGVCRSQLMEIQGARGNDPWIPHLLGHEGSGIVIEVGKKVQKVKAGDQVILSWLKGFGLEAPGAQYLCEGQKINSGCVTTFSNYTVVSENRLSLKPKNLSFDLAALFGCAIPTGSGMVLNQIKPSVNSSIILIGLGGIGLSSLMTLISLGIKKIIVIDTSEIKLDLARKLGINYTFNSNKYNLAKNIFNIMPNGADICIESAGKISTIEFGFSIINKFTGKLFFASHPPNNQKIKLSPHELLSGKQIIGSWGEGTNPDSDIPVIYELFKNNNIPLETLITKKYKLEEINNAFDDLESGKVFRPLVSMEHS